MKIIRTELVSPKVPKKIVKMSILTFFQILIKYEILEIHACVIYQFKAEDMLFHISAFVLRFKA